MAELILVKSNLFTRESFIDSMRFLAGVSTNFASIAMTIGRIRIDIDNESIAGL